MTHSLDHTHDPKALSFVDSANQPGADFPIQNLPFGRIRHAGLGQGVRVVVAIGDMALDVVATARTCGFHGLAAEAAEACDGGDLNRLIALSPAHATSLRHALFDSLNQETPAERRAPESALVSIDESEFLIPVDIGDYTDFFCSMHHAVNASRIFKRPEPLRPNYHYLPVGYHSRASSVVVSGTPVTRPKGELEQGPEQAPVYAPCKKLDYEVELAIVVRGGNRLGETIPIDGCDDAIFGVCLQNDWSARDIQRWESLPLGPFLAKSFATTISPWIVTTDALRPFVQLQTPRGDGIPQAPDHLKPKADEDTTWAIKITCAIESEKMRSGQVAPRTVAVSDLMDMHWSPKQMVAHHASNGCNLRAGDMLGSGTISGPEKDSWGCLLELTHDGQDPLSIGDETRGYLSDGDRIVLSGGCTSDEARSIGFGVCEGIVMPAN